MYFTALEQLLLSSIHGKYDHHGNNYFWWRQITRLEASLPCRAIFFLSCAHFKHCYFSFNFHHAAEPCKDFGGRCKPQNALIQKLVDILLWQGDEDKIWVHHFFKTKIVFFSRFETEIFLCLFLDWDKRMPSFFTYKIHCIVQILNIQKYVLSLGCILDIFLQLRKFKPQYSYKEMNGFYMST